MSDTEKALKSQLEAKTNELSAAIESCQAPTIDIDALQRKIQTQAGEIEVQKAQLVELGKKLRRLTDQNRSLIEHNERLHARYLHADVRANFWRTRCHDSLDDLASLGSLEAPLVPETAGESL